MVPKGTAPNDLSPHVNVLKTKNRAMQQQEIRKLSHKYLFGN